MLESKIIFPCVKTGKTFFLFLVFVLFFFSWEKKKSASGLIYVWGSLRVLVTGLVMLTEMKSFQPDTLRRLGSCVAPTSSVISPAVSATGKGWWSLAEMWIWFHPASRCCHSSHLISWIINEQPVTHGLNLCTTWCQASAGSALTNTSYITDRTASFFLFLLPLHKKAFFAVILTDIPLVVFFFVFFFPFPAAASLLEIDFSRMAYSLLHMLQENVLTTWLILLYELLGGKIGTEALRVKSRYFSLVWSNLFMTCKWCGNFFVLSKFLDFSFHPASECQNPSALIAVDSDHLLQVLRPAPNDKRERAAWSVPLPANQGVTTPFSWAFKRGVEWHTQVRRFILILLLTPCRTHPDWLSARSSALSRPEMRFLCCSCSFLLKEIVSIMQPGWVAIKSPLSTGSPTSGKEFLLFLSVACCPQVSFIHHMWSPRYLSHSVREVIHR